MSNKRYSLSTISKEIRAHITIENKRAFQQNYNSYVHCFSCTKNHICPECPSARKFKLCKRCSICNAFCDFYEKEPCSKSSPSTCATDMKIAAHALYKTLLLCWLCKPKISGNSFLFQKMFFFFRSRIATFGPDTYAST